MRVIGLLRIKNEARWIGEVLDAMRPLCSQILVMDDHSTDDTANICRAHDATVFESPFSDLDEGRDKNWLLTQISERPDWCVMVDGDEILEPAAAGKLLPLMESGAHESIRMRVVYLWDRRDQIRTDGIYANFRRGSAFRFDPQARFRNGFHCSNVPALGWQPRMVDSGVQLLHLGYLHREDRLRKFAWYNAKDPNNRAEDGYRHMVQGDLPEVPSSWVRGKQLRHAGPLMLEPLAVTV